MARLSQSADSSALAALKLASKRNPSGAHREKGLTRGQKGLTRGTDPGSVLTIDTLLNA